MPVLESHLETAGRPWRIACRASSRSAGASLYHFLPLATSHSRISAGRTVAAPAVLSAPFGNSAGMAVASGAPAGRWIPRGMFLPAGSKRESTPDCVPVTRIDDGARSTNCDEKVGDAGEGMTDLRAGTPAASDGAGQCARATLFLRGWRPGSCSSLHSAASPPASSTVARFSDSGS